VYFRSEWNYSPPMTLLTVHRPMEASIVCVRRCIPEADGIVPLPLTLFVNP